uniref:Immunoglobulin V-set domain-containing protein n=1 Tax=Pyxicephalus adspersus TaxID=30357 RepID=A0AAV3ADR6_PYXAD|nr:TPA: hypothetical protein GDO54_013555 [Pyxicephalus adspersus]
MSVFASVHTEISLSISAPAIVKPTQSMKMTCHVSGVLITDGSKMHAVNFVRQFAGNKMEFLAHLNYAQGTAYNPAIQSRLSLSRDTAKNEVHLEFKSLETTDSATYYCASEKPTV